MEKIKDEIENGKTWLWLTSGPLQKRSESLI